MSILERRYASPEMCALFSEEARARVWRRLWIALARAEMELGLPIQPEQIAEMERAELDLEVARQHELRTRHDVMAHILAFGDAAPSAKGILHMGATSTFVTDNGDLLQMRQALQILEVKLAQVLEQLALFAESYRDVACLAYTHLQPAQPTTVGKRATLWAHDLLRDLHALQRFELPFLGVKGATGTAASFLQLLGSAEKVEKLEKRVAEQMGFEQLLPVAGQTYSRKIDAELLNLLSGIGVSASKIATDYRLLAHEGELEEPFESEQVGSSAMPHKRNPILSERICGLARYLIQGAGNGSWTAATQWLERSLDDSSNRRLVLPQCFLTADALLNLLLHLTHNPVLHPAQIEANLSQAMPKLALESILMVCVEKGADRQEMHERLRHHAHESDLLLRVIEDPEIPIDREELEKTMRVERFIGLAPQQTDRFVQQIRKAIAPYSGEKRLSPSIEF